jgi:hypothetical protein
VYDNDLGPSRPLRQISIRSADDGGALSIDRDSDRSIPIADMVVVKLDSVPDPALDEKVYQTQYQAIDAIIKSVSGHGCS